MDWEDFAHGNVGVNSQHAGSHNLFTSIFRERIFFVGDVRFTLHSNGRVNML
jgi:hypothetical protein